MKLIKEAILQTIFGYITTILFKFATKRETNREYICVGYSERGYTKKFAFRITHEYTILGKYKCLTTDIIPQEVPEPTKEDIEDFLKGTGRGVQRG